MRRWLTVIAAAAVAVSVAGSASAARPWPGRTISYSNQAGVWAWSVDQAVAAWNGAGLRVRFVRARSPQTAQLVVSTRRLPRLGPDVVVAGRATVGYLGGRRAEVHLARPGRGFDRFTMARIAAHELGHVLGLRHTRASCALMIHAGSALRWGGCPRHRESQWRCRMVERDDLRRALRLYGGRPRPLREPAMCFKYDSPASPRELAAELAAVESPAGWSLRGRLRWRNPTSASFAGVEVAYAPSRCPSRPGESGATVVLAEADDSFAGDRRWHRRRGRTSSAAVSLDGLAPGTYCFAVWSTDEAALRRSRAAVTTQVTVGPASPAPRTP
ncbi:MAG: matrixin family metalloprotease [Thermoleophilia bacterium]|nr:matrixin family metalloprotease [Thermoleophilia bacterium]